MKKCGIYIIKNDVNKLVYIGQSVDIVCRWYAHKQAVKNKQDISHNTKIHLAMEQIGIDHFYYEILEECEYNDLNAREIYWISQYDSYNNGYNMTLGGESNKGETNGRAILTQSEVEDIRMAYNAHIPFREVLDKYKNTISKRGLQKIWHFETWQHIMPEVYTEENRKWHSTVAKANINGNIHLGKTNKQRACSEEEIQQMRVLRSQGLSYQAISEQMNRSSSVVRKYCLFQETTNLDKTTGITIKNIETGLIFTSITKASKWAKCDRHTINKYINTNKAAGIVPTTDEPAHWISL